MFLYIVSPRGEVCKGEAEKNDVKMNNEKTAVYQCRERITNPEVLKFARDFENCPYTPSAKDMMYAFYQSIGVDIEYDEIFADK